MAMGRAAKMPPEVRADMEWAQVQLNKLRPN